MSSKVIPVLLCALLASCAVTDAVLDYPMSFFDEEGHETGELCSYIQTNTDLIKQGITAHAPDYLDDHPATYLDVPNYMAILKTIMF